MPRHIPTPTDIATGARVRQLRKLAGETQAQTVERSGVGFGYASLSRVEEGKRILTVPEATKLAAHFNTTVDKVFVLTPEQHKEENAWKWRGAPVPTVTEQAWLGNDKPAEPLPLFPLRPVVPDPADTVAAEYVIDLTNPLTPDEYREQVWIPYLEYRYQTDQKAS